MIEISAAVPPTDFWGVVFPAYLGAAGAIISGGVAAWALVREIGTRKGLAEVAREANRESTEDARDSRAAVRAMGEASVRAAAEAAAATEASRELGGEPDRPDVSAKISRTDLSPTDEVPWEIRTLRRGHYVLRNASETPARLLSIQTQSGADVSVHFSLPLVVQPGEGYDFIVHHVLGGPAIITVVFRWESADGTINRWRQFL